MGHARMCFVGSLKGHEGPVWGLAYAGNSLVGLSFGLSFFLSNFSETTTTTTQQKFITSEWVIRWDCEIVVIENDVLFVFICGTRRQCAHSFCSKWKNF